MVKHMKPDAKLLQFILESGILDSGSVLNEFMATQREKVIIAMQSRRPTEKKAVGRHVMLTEMASVKT